MRLADAANAFRGKREGKIPFLEDQIVVPERLPLLEPHTEPTIREWLPESHAHLSYSRRSTASPDDLWEAANEVRLADAPRLCRLIRWRLGSHAPPSDTTFRDFFRTGIFIELEEGERHAASGVAGRIWTPSGQYERFATAAEYKEYEESGTAKVVLLTGVREHPGGSEIFNEAEILVHGRRTRMFFWPFWQVVHPFGRLIATEGLAVAVRRAESRAPRGGSRP